LSGRWEQFGVLEKSAPKIKASHPTAKDVTADAIAEDAQSFDPSA
jgi:hypothetical protein